MSSSDDHTDSGETDEPSSEGSKLFLGGLSWGASEEKLRHHFEQYGEILEVVVMKDKNTGNPRGFGFITYKEPIADIVVKDVHIIDGRLIDTKKSISQESKPKARKIFVGGLSPDTSEEDFKSYFESFGEISEVQIMQDHMTGRSRGFGFITFEEDSSAQKVFEAGIMHELGGKRVEVKPATPKGNLAQQTPRSQSLGSGSSSSGHHQHNPRRNPEFLIDTSMALSPYGSGMVAPGTPPYGAFGMFSYAPAMGRAGSGGIGGGGRGSGMMPTAAAATPTGYAMQYPAAAMPPQYMYIQPQAVVPGYGYGTFPPGAQAGVSYGGGRGRGGGRMSGHQRQQHHHHGSGGGGGGRGQ